MPQPHPTHLSHLPPDLLIFLCGLLPRASRGNLAACCRELRDTILRCCTTRLSLQLGPQPLTTILHAAGGPGSNLRVLEVVFITQPGGVPDADAVSSLARGVTRLGGLRLLLLRSVQPLRGDLGGHFQISLFGTAICEDVAVAGKARYTWLWSPECYRRPPWLCRIPGCGSCTTADPDCGSASLGRESCVPIGNCKGLLATGSSDLAEDMCSWHSGSADHHDKEGEAAEGASVYTEESVTDDDAANRRLLSSLPLPYLLVQMALSAMPYLPNLTVLELVPVLYTVGSAGSSGIMPGTAAEPVVTTADVLQLLVARTPQLRHLRLAAAVPPPPAALEVMRYLPYLATLDLRPPTAAAVRALKAVARRLLPPAPGGSKNEPPTAATVCYHSPQPAGPRGLSLSHARALAACCRLRRLSLEHLGDPDHPWSSEATSGTIAAAAIDSADGGCASGTRIAASGSGCVCMTTRRTCGGADGSSELNHEGCAERVLSIGLARRGLWPKPKAGRVRHHAEVEARMDAYVGGARDVRNGSGAGGGGGRCHHRRCRCRGSGPDVGWGTGDGGSVAAASAASFKVEVMVRAMARCGAEVLVLKVDGAEEEEEEEVEEEEGTGRVAPGNGADGAAQDHTSIHTLQGDCTAWIPSDRAWAPAAAAAAAAAAAQFSGTACAECGFRSPAAELGDLFGPESLLPTVASALLYMPYLRTFKLDGFHNLTGEVAAALLVRLMNTSGLCGCGEASVAAQARVMRAMAGCCGGGGGGGGWEALLEVVFR
ncbi:hypothetical protein VOLCADRAFT_92641 [Volvox carteri f. nagariensis]|uniref:F-box domain-containing protein n=1 Tax=Volvox carteri f. nagariensis TaxID=3068 RepID=D8U065_VOLCA|nr:uncharacterized protein VOLCADRAFT_92641 [Volvox carteri f. nagariensis]EFJ46885.1 hypothetical protein VOLCADRAFT_92641 [Volvox carteri f. nagariensis]|eukprot:XP_002952094.1 hypothetical protein VOLCADRAFT_92641 [Volvox carteri f. nagariensis]